MNLVISPLAKGLFNGAMYESGGMAQSRLNPGELQPMTTSKSF
jgi:hypothetical protein